jgi:hypothetical protein
VLAEHVLLPVAELDQLERELVEVGETVGGHAPLYRHRPPDT